MFVQPASQPVSPDFKADNEFWSRTTLPERRGTSAAAARSSSIGTRKPLWIKSAAFNRRDVRSNSSRSRRSTFRRNIKWSGFVRWEYINERKPTSTTTTTSNSSRWTVRWNGWALDKFIRRSSSNTVAATAVDYSINACSDRWSIIRDPSITICWIVRRSNIARFFNIYRRWSLRWWCYLDSHLNKWNVWSINSASTSTITQWWRSLWRNSKWWCHNRRSLRSGHNAKWRSNRRSLRRDRSTRRNTCPWKLYWRTVWLSQRTTRTRFVWSEHSNSWSRRRFIRNIYDSFFTNSSSYEPIRRWSTYYYNWRWSLRLISAKHRANEYWNGSWW